MYVRKCRIVKKFLNRKSRYFVIRVYNYVDINVYVYELAASVAKITLQK